MCAGSVCMYVCNFLSSHTVSSQALNHQALSDVLKGYPVHHVARTVDLGLHAVCVSTCLLNHA